MKPKERRDSGQADLLRSRLDAIIDMDHALVKLSRTIDWSFLEERFGAVYEDKPGRPPLPTRLMAGLAILKHLRPVRRGAVRALGGEPLLPVLLRRGVLPAPAGVRSLVTDALAQPDGRGAASGPAAGEPVGCRQDQGDQTIRVLPGDRRHDGAAQERDVSDRCQASEPGAREAGAAGAAHRGGFTPVLCEGGQVRPDKTSALRPCQAVQACQAGAEDVAYLSRPGHARHQPQDR